VSFFKQKIFTLLQLVTEAYRMPGKIFCVNWTLLNWKLNWMHTVI